MRRLAGRLSVLFVVLATAAVSALGQSPVPDAWLIEVESEGRTAVRSAPLSLSSTEFHAAGLRRRPDWKMPGKGDPVQAIGFRARLNGRGASITISELSGKRFGEKRKRIAEVALAKGEGRKVLEMADFGFESIILKLVPADSVAASEPAIVNPSPTVSATIVSTDPVNPAFTIRFVNNSRKAVDGIIWRTENAGRARLLGTAEKKYDETLIEANGTYDLVVRATITDDSGTRLIFDAIVFADGTVHGDAAAADSFLRLKAGRRAALGKLVAALAAGEQPDLSLLIAQVAELKNEVPQTDGRATTAEGYAFLRVVDEAIESLRSLSEKIQKNERPERDFGDIRSFYQTWYARLLK